MMDVGRHPNIELLTHSELKDLNGSAGNFTATVIQHPGFVNEDVCTGCGDCADNCPKAVPNEFDCGLASRKAIYRPFPQAVPNVYFRDPESCLNKKFKTIRCHHCEKACQQNAINYDMPPREFKIPVGAVIVAVGADVYDPYDMKSYGYSTSPNILTGLEFERLLNASGPSSGEIIRPSDKQKPDTIAFVQCVGVRGENDNQYCSRFCCMNSVKDALLIKDHHPDINKVTIFYSDLRCFGKGYESLYLRTLDRPEIAYFRGKPSKITECPDSKDLFIHVEDTLTGQPDKIRVNMVVLASAAVPAASTPELSGILGINLNEAGFFASKNNTTNVLSSSKEGIFLCGCSKGPEDIPDSVAQGSGSAALAETFVQDFKLEDIKEEIPKINTDGPPRIGVFLCHCGINIAGVIDIEGVQEYIKTLPGVVHIQNDLFLCSDGSQKNIQQKIVEKKLNRVVAAACTPRTHEPIFQETCARVGLNPYLFEMANVRDQCSWVHSNIPEQATRRAKDQIRMSVHRARWLQPLERNSISMQRSVLVIGGGIAGIQAALTLDAQGIPVYLVEKTQAPGGRMNILDKILPEGQSSLSILEEKISELQESNVKVFLNTEVTDVKGFVGSFDVKTTQGPLKAGSIIIATGADVYTPENEYGYGKLNVFTNMEWEQITAKSDKIITINNKEPETVAFIQCVGSRNKKNPHCSRICCDTTIKQALQLREKNINVTVFYRDMRATGHGMEELYRQARGKGVLFIRFPENKVPVVEKYKDRCKVKAFDTMLSTEVELPVDAVVLAAGLIPRERDMKKIQEMLKVPGSPDGFLMERHPKLGPVETFVEGVFACGCVQGPKGIGDSISQANAAAAKALMLVNKEAIELSPTTCVVNEEKCRGCGQCISVCDFNAPELVETKNGQVSRINEALCKGCGTCAAWCPTDAITAKHFTDRQIEAMMDTMLNYEVV